MNKMMKFLIFVLVSMLLYSCVPTKKFNDLKVKNDAINKERDELKSENDLLKTRLNEFTADIEKFKKIVNPLLEDTNKRGKDYRALVLKNAQTEEQYETLYKNFEKLKKDYEEQEKKISRKLNNTTDDLLKREDEVKKMESFLQEQKTKLDALKRDLDNKDLELKTKDFELKKQTTLLEERNRTLTELQGILNRKDSVVKALKVKVASALKGFENDGLSVYTRNGKVYVSLDEKLLFNPAKWDVDPKGKEALKKLAKVLEQNSEINVMVEGHTDNIKLQGKNDIEDNWDLSAKRATSIVKFLLANGEIEADRLMATGRGEFQPIDTANTTEARQKNRRTEIILTPKLDELFKVLESN